jgi:hypothetical protein
MIRVHIVCEGQTEEAFVKRVLVDYFSTRGIFLNPLVIGTTGHKGGNVRIERLAHNIGELLKGDTTSWCTTFIDFYGLPKDFARRQGSRRAKRDRG